MNPIKFWILEIYAGIDFQLVFNYKSKKIKLLLQSKMFSTKLKNINLLFELSDNNGFQNSA